MAAVPRNASQQRQWYIVRRWQEFDGESLANVLRLITIGVFFLVQLLHFYGLATPSERDVLFHRAATGLAAAGSFLSLAVLVCLRRGIFPAALMYVSTGADLLLLSVLAAVGGGPNSPLIFAYFLIIALAALRYRLPLVWFAALGSMAGYLTLVGFKDDRWFDARHVVRPVEQLMMLASLALTGVVLGQIIRRARHLAEEYSQRVSSSTEISTKGRTGDA